MFEINFIQLKGLSMNPFFGELIKFKLNSVLWTHIKKQNFSNIYLHSPLHLISKFCAVLSHDIS